MTRAMLAALLLLGLGAPGALAETEKEAWIAYNQDLLKKRFHDPDSARFREVFFSRKAGVPVACGEVDAKNAQGDYVGFVRFVGAGSVGVFLPDDIDDFETLWSSFCR